MTTNENPKGVYGTLMSGDTAEPIGRATRAQYLASMAAGPEGFILIDCDGGLLDARREVRGARKVYVEPPDLDHEGERPTKCEHCGSIIDVEIRSDDAYVCQSCEDERTPDDALDYGDIQPDDTLN